MKILYILTLFALIHPTPLYASKPLKVYILAGQSNMQGKGQVKGKDIPGTVEYCIANDPSGKYKFLKGSNNQLAEQKDVWIYYERDGKVLTENLSPRFGSNDTFIGPELSFGEQIQQQENQQILLIKVAWGGKSLGKDFLPPSADGETGFYYNEMLRCIHDALGNLKKHFPKYQQSQGYEIAGFCWHQGWNDHVNKKFTAAYAENLEHLIKDLRVEFKTDFPVVVATTGMAMKRDALKDTPKDKPIEKAQRSVAKKAAFRGNVAVVDTKQYWKSAKNSPVPNGRQHYHWNKSAEIYMDIGFACAEAFAKLKK